MTKKLFLSAFAGVLLTTLSYGNLSVAPPASDAMIIQRNTSTPFSGTASPDNAVTISFLGKKAETRPDANGNWTLSFPVGPEVGGPHPLTIESAGETIQFANVLVGDVWFCSGQSNMQFPMRVIAPDEIAKADIANLRLLSVERIASSKPLDQNPARWEMCTPATIGEFSATAYFFGRAIAQETGIPIGLISSAWGGKKAETFTRREVLLAHEDLKPLVDRWDTAMAAYPEALKNFNENGMKEWEKRNAARTSRGLEPAPKPRPPIGPEAPDGPSNIWNGMIHPYINQPVTGFIWYQGESNAQVAEQYRPLLSTMITDWRTQWSLADTPFYIVQLAGYMPRYGQQYKFLETNPDSTPPPLESEWAELRDAQSFATNLKNVALATAIDIGEAKDIHPKAKQEVGRRLSLLALNRIYDKPAEDQGPTFESMSTQEASVEVRFTHADGLRSSNEKPLAGFAIAGEDRKFHWAQAEIRGNTVSLSSPEVPNPVAVRYAWEDFPSANLANAAGLPAFPFRTDNWPGLTDGKR